MRFAEAKMEEPMHYYAFELLYWCGIREGELLALTPSDFDFNKRTLRINKSYQRINGRDIITEPKTPKSNRVIKIPSFLCDEMQDYIGMLYGAEKDTRLFPISKTALYRAMKTGCEKAEVKKIRIHDLRHPYVKPKTKKYESFYVPSGSEKLPVQLNNLSFKACLLSYSSRYEKVLCNIFYLNPVFRKDIHFLNQ